MMVKRKKQPTDTMKITTIAPWFGGSRSLASEVGELLDGCRWVGIPFAGGMPELIYIDAPVVVVSDLHRHIINLANCLRDPSMGPRLYRRLRRAPLHTDVLKESQDWCKRHREDMFHRNGEEAAYHYFISCWMGRSGKSGSDDEFCGNIPVRWNSNGGDSATRYNSAVRSIIAWRRILRKVNLVTQDCFEFLEKAQDAPGHGIYCDPPFPDAGARYRHKFSDNDHMRLSRALTSFQNARVVCRFYDHPLIRELYPETDWRWRHFVGKKQSNAKSNEVLLTNKKTEARSLFDNHPPHDAAVHCPLAKNDSAAGD